jgi:HKD family nuclease
MGEIKVKIDLEHFAELKMKTYEAQKVLQKSLICNHSNIATAIYGSL